jgi:NADH-quinone oxidoreductase subunit E
LPGRPPAEDAEPAGTEPRETTRPSGRTGETPEEEAADARVAAADTPAERAGAAQTHPDKGAEYGQPRGRQRAGTENPPAAEPATGTSPPVSPSPNPPRADGKA